VVKLVRHVACLRNGKFCIIAGPPVNLGFACCKSLFRIRRGRRLVTALEPAFLLL
jgi:hypothetical protein